MNRPYRIAALALVVTCVVGAGKPKWATFASPEGRFEVLMPGEVKQFTVEVTNAFGPGVLHMNVATAAEGTMLVANWVDYPPDLAADLPEQLLDDAREGALDNLGGKLISEKQIELGEHVGREILIEVPKQDRLFRARVYLVGNRLYQTVVFGPPTFVKSKDARRYLDSFKLLER